MIIHRETLRALPLLAVALSMSTFFPATALGDTVEMIDECPPFEDRSDEDCTKIGSYEEFRELIQTEKPEGELVLCPFDVQLSPDDKATWIKTDLHLTCQQMGKCTLRDGEYHLKVHGSNRVTVQGFNFVGASHSAFRVWEKTQNVQKVCHCSFESNKGSQKGTSVRVEGKKVFVGHSVFTDNHSDQQGAGIYTYNDACVYQSQFISNSAQRGSGIFVDTGGSLTMKDSDFQLNVALGSGGPAVYINDGGQYVDGGGNTATNNEGGKDCEGVLAKTECELVFTTSDEAKGGTTEAEGGEGLGGETKMPTKMTDSPTDVPEATMTPTSTPVGDATLDPTMFPSASPIVVTSEPTKTSSQTPSASTTFPSSIPTMSTTFDPTTNATLLATNGTAADEQAGKNAIEPTNSTKYLTLVNFNHEDGALELCEGDCNKDNDCKGRLLCFKRVDNGGWRNMMVPGCEADENHPMRKVDYCYDPFASTPTEIGRGEPETDSDPVVNNGNTVDETTAVTPAPTVGSTTIEPTLAPVTPEPSASPVSNPLTAVPVGDAPTQGPSASPVSDPPTKGPSASPVSAHPTASPVSDPPTKGPSALPASAPPTASPVSDPPTKVPSASPVSHPPTASPVSDPPTAAPVTSESIVSTRTSPTSSPTKGPTSEFIDNSESNDPKGGYFNYDINSDFGPRKWHKVKPQKTEEYNYWKEFKDVIKEDLDKNYCDSSAQQSPINVFDAGGTCLEYHQIRDRPGDFLEDDTEVEKVIGQNKLRVIWPRRLGDEPDPPGADIPKGWGHIIDAINTDIVIPAEHTINGRQFVGEYRIFHMHDGGKGAAVITSLMEIHPLNRRNSHLQKLINEFQLKFEEDMLKCQNKGRRKRGLRALVSSKGQNGVSSLRGKDNRLSSKEKFPSYRRRRAQHERDLERKTFLHDDPSDPYTSYGRYDPYDPELITSLWFYGYEGSLTEPPCTPFLSWRIMDKPMYVSTGQLKQMKNLIFNHVDENCQPTSNHYKGNTARPIQKQKQENEVYRCTCKDFTSDKMRAQSGVYQCSNDQYKLQHPEGGFVP